MANMSTFSRRMDSSPAALAPENSSSNPSRSTGTGWRKISMWGESLGNRSGFAITYPLSFSVSTPQYFTVMVMGCAAPSSGRPLVMGAPAQAATSPSPVASMYTFADRVFSPSLLHTVRPVILPCSVCTAPTKVWKSTVHPASASFSSRRSLRPSASKGVMVLVYCLVSGTCPGD